MKKRILYLFIFTSLLASCTSKKETNVSNESRSETQNIEMDYKILSQKEPEGFKISSIHIDTSINDNGLQSILLTMSIFVKDEAFKSIKSENYSSYFLDVKCTGQNGNVYLNRSELFKSPTKKKFLHNNRDCFFSSASQRNLEIALPFRNLNLKEGLQNMQIDIEIFPAKFEDEASSLNMKMVKEISTESKGGITLNLDVNAPKLYKATLKVLKTKVNTQLVNPTKFDVAGTGKGYPDMFWEVYCGNDYIYNSPVEKNKIEYLKAYSSPAFYCTLKDIIHLDVIDYDNGPFNTQDDIIGKWQFKINELKKNVTDTIKVGRLEYLIVQAQLDDEAK